MYATFGRLTSPRFAASSLNLVASASAAFCVMSALRWNSYSVSRLDQSEKRLSLITHSSSGSVKLKPCAREIRRNFAGLCRDMCRGCDHGSTRLGDESHEEGVALAAVAEQRRVRRDVAPAICMASVPLLLASFVLLSHRFGSTRSGAPKSPSAFAGSEIVAPW